MYICMYKVHIIRTRPCRCTYKTLLLSLMYIVLNGAQALLLYLVTCWFRYCCIRVGIPNMYSLYVQLAHLQQARDMYADV